MYVGILNIQSQTVSPAKMFSLTALSFQTTGKSINRTKIRTKNYKHQEIKLATIFKTTQSSQLKVMKCCL